MEFNRQTQIFNPENQKLKIHIIGAGSTGSFITLNLAKLGFNDIKVTDFDKVEQHNLPNQFFRIGDVGKLKVDALKEIVKDFSGIEIKTENIEITEDYNFDIDLNSLIVLCVDTMEARQIIFKIIKDLPIKLVDTRMGGEGFSIHYIDLIDEQEKIKFEKGLFEPTRDTQCGAKAIIYTILSIASETTNLIKKIDKNEYIPLDIRREMKTYRFIERRKKENEWN